MALFGPVGIRIHESCSHGYQSNEVHSKLMLNLVKLYSSYRRPTYGIIRAGSPIRIVLGLFRTLAFLDSVRVTESSPNRKPSFHFPSTTVLLRMPAKAAW